METIYIVGIVICSLLIVTVVTLVIYFSSAEKSETTVPTAGTTTTPTTPIVPIVPKTCPDVFGYGIKPAGTVVTVGCSLGPNYTGNMINKCNADGTWSQENNCVSSGNTDLVDISGNWNFMYAGNVGTATIVFNKNTGTGTVIANGTGEPGYQVPGGPRDITYISGKGYTYNGNQAAAFTDKTYNKLDGGNYSFTRV